MNLISEKIVRFCQTHPDFEAIPYVQKYIDYYETTIRELEKDNCGDGCRCGKGTTCRNDNGIHTPCDSNVAHVEESERIRPSED